MPTYQTSQQTESCLTGSNRAPRRAARKPHADSRLTGARLNVDCATTAWRSAITTYVSPVMRLSRLHKGTLVPSLLCRGFSCCGKVQVPSLGALRGRHAQLLKDSQGVVNVMALGISLAHKSVTIKLATLTMKDGVSITHSMPWQAYTAWTPCYRLHARLLPAQSMELESRRTK